MMNNIRQIWNTAKCVALGGMLLAVAACSSDDDVFSESSAARMQNYLEKAQQTLVGAEYGWAIDYYPERSQQGYGGFIYAAKFTENEVGVASELLPDTTITSLYRLTTDMGPVLSFDTFNMMMHYFATPSQERYQAYDGDFEFVIDSIADDFIRLHGKRNQNTMYMHRLDCDIETYINRVNDFIKNFPIVGGECAIGSETDSLIIDASRRRATVITADSTYASAFVFYDKGVRLYSPVNVQGKTIGNFEYNDDAMTLTNTYAGSTDVVMRGIMSPALVQKVLGEQVGFADAGGSRQFTVNRLDHYDFISSADWCTVSTSGNTLTITATPNTTGRLRSARLVVSVGIAVSTIIVSQADISDLLGDYYLGFYDSNSSEQYLDAVLALDDNGSPALSVTMNRTDMVIPLSYEPETCSFLWESGVPIATIHNESTGITYYFAPIFMDAQGTAWSNHERGSFAVAPMAEYEGIGVAASWGGTLPDGSEIAQVFIGGYSSSTISSATYVAYLERMQYPILQKKEDGDEAKKRQLFRGKW